MQGSGTQLKDIPNGTILLLLICLVFPLIGLGFTYSFNDELNQVDSLRQGSIIFHYLVNMEVLSGFSLTRKVVAMHGRI